MSLGSTIGDAITGVVPGGKIGIAVIAILMALGALVTVHVSLVHSAVVAAEGARDSAWQAKIAALNTALEKERQITKDKVAEADKRHAAELEAKDRALQEQADALQIARDQKPLAADCSSCRIPVERVLTPRPGSPPLKSH